MPRLAACPRWQLSALKICGGTTMAIRTLPEPLVSNGYTLSSLPERLGWLKPSDPDTAPSVLREQLESEGYIWLKGIFEKDLVLDLRRRYFSAFANTNLLAPGSDLVEGIYSGEPYDKQAVSRIHHEFLRWASYESFCYTPRLWQFYEALLGGPVYLHKRKLVRLHTPGETATTGAHYDLTYLRGGTERVLSSFIPIGDIPVEMGGLIYLEGSHGYGRQVEAELSVKNASLSPEERISAYNRNMTDGGMLTKDLPTLAERLNARWLAADYETGDMVIHTSYMIHAATINTSPEKRMRLSTDIRYQLVSDAIDERWTNHVVPDDNL
jgi:ectoine hydroxylase-related dioxygenase (phytanoyl-CoA dioxygenase family)